MLLLLSGFWNTREATQTPTFWGVNLMGKIVLWGFRSLQKVWSCDHSEPQGVIPKWWMYFFFCSASRFCALLHPKAVLFVLCVAHPAFLCIAIDAENTEHRSKTQNSAFSVDKRIRPGFENTQSAVLETGAPAFVDVFLLTRKPVSDCIMQIKYNSKFLLPSKMQICFCVNERKMRARSKGWKQATDEADKKHNMKTIRVQKSGSASDKSNFDSVVLKPPWQISQSSDRPPGGRGTFSKILNIEWELMQPLKCSSRPNVYAVPQQKQSVPRRRARLRPPRRRYRRRCRCWRCWPCRRSGSAAVCRQRRHRRADSTAASASPAPTPAASLSQWASAPARAEAQSHKVRLLSVLSSMSMYKTK